MDKSEGQVLRDYLIDNNINAPKLASLIGVEKQTIYYQLKQDIISDSFKYRLAQHGVKLFHLSTDQDSTNTLSEPSEHYQKRKKSTAIPVYDVPVTATAMENISQIAEHPSYHVSVPGYEDCNFGLQAYGHSMYPTIESGSLLLCRRVNDKSIIMLGEIYVIRTADYLMVKRLQKSTEKSCVLCTSDNYEKRASDFKRFEPFDLPVDKILDLYLVKGIIKKTQS